MFLIRKFQPALAHPAALTVALALALLAPMATAATFTVNSSADTSDTPVGGCNAVPPQPSTCTLRGAIAAANAAAGTDAIVFAASIAGGNTTTAGSDYPATTGPVSINGLLGGTGTTRFTANGNGANSLFRFTGSAGSYSISNLVITNARGETNQGGGGIYFVPSAASTLTLSNVDLTANRSVATGQAPGNGLYVGASHTVNITGGVINNNIGVGVDGADFGGGIFNAGSLSISGATLSGNSASQGGGIFNGAGAGATLSLTNVTMNSNIASGLGGGGIYNFNGNLSAIGTVLDGNQATGGANVGGGGIYSELDSGGSTTLTRTTLKNNSVASTGTGGGIYARKVVSSADFTILDSTLDKNSTQSGQGGGLYVNRGLVQITNSTISNNVTGSSGGGVYLDVDGSGGRVAISNSTISKNTATVGGGIGVNKDNTSTSSMVHTTLAENQASDASGGGGVSYGVPGDGVLNPNLVFPGVFGSAFTSNIIVKNTANNVLQNCRNPFSHSNANDSGYNITDDSSCGFTQSSDRSVVPPAPLGLLADNLGSTQTHGLLAGNPAIDYANPLYVTALDQRGAAPQDGDQTGGVFRDAGSYEFGGFGVMHFDQASYTVREDAGTLTTVVKRYGNPDTATSVKVSSANGTATAPADYVSISSQNVPFAANDLSEDVLVTIADDDVFPEPNEQFSLMLFAPQKGSDLGPRGTATVTITDVEEGAFQFAQGSYTVDEGGTPAVNENSVVTVTVTRVSGSDKAVTVNYSVVAGGTSAAAGEDYVAASATGSLSWADGDSAPKTFDVQLIDDIKDETGAAASRILQLTIADPPGRARLGTPVNTTITINDDDPLPRVTLAVNPGTFNEAGGTATVTATLVGSTATTPVTVNLVFSGTANRDATCGTAQSPADYTCSGNVITIPAGSSSASITLTGIQDVNNETDETVIVDIATTSANAAEQGTQQVTATIAEVAAVRGDFSLSSATYTAMEASGSLVVTVTRANGDDGAATVQCATQDGTAVAGTDFNSSPTPATLSWTDNESGNKTCTITLVNDTDRESNKSFTVKLANATGAGLGTPNQAAVTLVSDEKPRFQFNLASTVVQEGTMGFQVTVEPLEAVNGEPVSIPYFTSDGTATAASMDYTAASGTLTWNNGDGAAKSFTISMIAADGAVEGNETFNVNLGSPSGGADVVGNNPTTITIVDPPAVRYKSANFASANEQDGGTIQVCVERLGNQQGAISVEYSVTGNTATEGADYTPPPGTPMRVLSWANNDTADKCYSITVIGDTVDEPDETITLRLLNPSSGVTIGSPNPSQATITDDDAAPSVSLSQTGSPLAENGGVATVTATLSNASTQAVTVNLSYTGTAANGSDYNGAATITIPAGQSSSSITLTALADAVDEGASESLTATISSVSANATVGTPNNASVTINDNDTAGFIVTQTGASTGVTEGGASDTVTLELLSQPTANVTITLNTGSQLSASPTSVTFTPANYNTPQTVTVSAVDDAIAEGNHSGTIMYAFASADALYNSFAASNNNVSIVDNDTPGVLVTESGGSTRVTEGGATDTLTVQLTSQPTANVTITTTSGSQLTVSPTTLTFTPANYNTPQTVTVTAVNDGQVEGTHSGTLSGSVSSTDARYNGSLGTVTVTITDNDSVTAGDEAPTVVVTQSGGSVNVSTSGGGGGAFSWTSLLGLISLLGLRRRHSLKMILVLVGLSPGLALAQDLSYNNVDLRYLLVSVDDPSVDASGFSLAGSWAVGKQVFLSASYGTAETDDFVALGTSGSSKSNTNSLGLGAHHSLQPGLDLTGSVSMVSSKGEGQGGFSGSANDTGYGLEAGLRGLATPSFEWGAALSYVAIFSDSGTGFSAQVLYHLNPSFSLAAGAGIGDNSTQFNLGTRFNF